MNNNFKGNISEDGKTAFALRNHGVLQSFRTIADGFADDGGKKVREPSPRMDAAIAEYLAAALEVANNVPEVEATALRVLAVLEKDPDAVKGFVESAERAIAAKEEAEALEAAEALPAGIAGAAEAVK